MTQEVIDKVIDSERKGQIMEQYDGGSVLVNGIHYEDNPIQYKEAIGYIGDESYFPQHFSVKDIKSIMKDFYKTFDENKFDDIAREWELPIKKPIKDFSKGMKVKLMFAAVFSRETKLLILDEATSGLDPVVRDEVLGLLQEYIADGERSVLFSTHILNDLEKFAKIDLKITKMQSKTIIFFIIVAVVLTIYFANPVWGIMYACFGSIIMSMIPFNYVNVPNCGFLNMLPATTLSRVVGRYLYAVIMTLAATLIGVVSVGIGTLVMGVSMEGLIPIVAIFFLFALLCQCLQYLLAYIMAPYHNQQVVIMLLRMLPAFIFFGVVGSYSEDIKDMITSSTNVNFISMQLTQANLMIGIFILAGVVLIVGAVCIALSYYLVKRRDMCC